jgi:hypothetical protein
MEVSHKEIYDRLIAVEAKVDRIEKNTEGVVKAFEAAQGAFAVLEWFGRLAKPILWVTGLVAAAGVIWQNVKLK